MKKTILIGVLSAATLLVGCTQVPEIKKRTSSQSDVEISKQNEEKNEIIGIRKINLGEYYANYTKNIPIQGVGEKENYMSIEIKSIEGMGELITLDMSAGERDNDEVKQQLQIIKKEIGISEEDFNKLKTALKESLTDEYKDKLEIKYQIKNKKIKNGDDISYIENIADNQKYKINVITFDYEKDPSIKVCFESKVRTNYIHNSGVEYNWSQLYNNEANIVMSKSTEIEDQIKNITISATLNDEKESELEELFAAACQQLDISENDMRMMYSKIKSEKGELQETLLGDEVYTVSEKGSPIWVYYTKTEQGGAVNIEIQMKGKDSMESMVEIEFEEKDM